MLSSAIDTEGEINPHSALENGVNGMGGASSDLASLCPPSPYTVLQLSCLKVSPIIYIFSSSLQYIILERAMSRLMPRPIHFLNQYIILKDIIMTFHSDHPHCACSQQKDLHLYHLIAQQNLEMHFNKQF